MDQQQPPTWRVVLAFVLAPLVPAALVAATTLFDGSPNGGYLTWLALFAVFGAYPATVLFGLPAFFLLRRRLKPRLASVVLVGGLVAAAPWLLIVVFVPNPDSAMIGEHVTVNHGVKTIWGWIEGLKLVGGVFLLGLLGGIAFWFAALWRPLSDARTAPAK